MAIAIACGVDQNQEDKNQETAERKSSDMVMAEDSELAVLMREIHEDAKQWRKSLEKGELVKGDAEIYTEMVESTPTNKNVQGPAFEGFSKYYQERLSAFMAATDLEAGKEAYNGLVSACVQCHQNYCHGPIPTIEKLYISDLQSGD